MQYKRIILILMVLFSSLVASPLRAENRRFFDVPVYHQYYAAIKYLYEEGVVQGYPDGLYRPQQEVNRAEFLKIVLGSQGIIPQDRDAMNCFPDVDKAQWYAKFVCYAFRNAIIDGYPDGLFRPGNSINKVEALKIIGNVQSWKTELFENETTTFIDVDESAWYYPFLQYAFANGLIDDIGEILHPGELLSRAKISEYVFRTMVFEKLNYSALTDSLLGAFIRANVLTKEEQKMVREYDVPQADITLEANITFPLVVHFTPNGVDLSADSEESFSERFNQWAKDFASKHITKVHISPFIDNGETFIPSQQLSRLGFKEHRLSGEFFDFLETLQANQVAISLDISALAPFFDTNNKSYIDPKTLQTILQEMDRNLSNYGITYAFTIADYPFDYVSILERMLMDQRVGYSCRDQDCSGRGETIIADISLDDGGFHNLTDKDRWIGLAKKYNKPVAIEASLSPQDKNILLFHLARFNPDIIIFNYLDQNTPLFPDSTFADLLTSISQWKRQSTDTPKPKANIVLHSMFDTTDNVSIIEAFKNNIGIITSAVTSAGYDMEVSVDEVLPEYDLYYVFNPAAIGEELYDMPENVSNVYRVEQKTFFHPVGEVQGTVYWSRVLENHFGLLGAAITQVMKLPDSAVFDFDSGSALVSFNGLSTSQNVPSFLHLIDTFLMSEKNKALLKASIGERGEIVLLLQFKNRYLVNGSHIHSDMGNVLTNLMAPQAIVLSPGKFIASSGTSRTVLYAYEESPVNMQLYAGARIEQFNAEHQKLVNPTVYLENGVLRGYLLKGSVVLVTP